MINLKRLKVIQAEAHRTGHLWGPKGPCTEDEKKYINEYWNRMPGHYCFDNVIWDLIRSSDCCMYCGEPYFPGHDSRECEKRSAAHGL